MDDRSDDGRPLEDKNEVLVKIRKGNEWLTFESLADANDAGVSFRSIASWIEKNYKRL